MRETLAATLALHDLEPAREDFRAEVLRGLRQRRKSLPCKFFYDERGSHLFDEICQLEEYYLTRTEVAILRRHAEEIARAAGPRCLLVEYGSGSSLKTRILLDHLKSPAGYVPIDISRAHLLRSARALAAAYSHLAVWPVCADYTDDFSLPASACSAGRPVVFFPGSSIGNFRPREAVAFLRRARRVCGPGGGLLIGVDLKKDPRILHAAYNDAQGVTAEFNRNLLVRINREIEGGFHVERFAHYAFYNPLPGRVEMHLVSREDQFVHVAGQDFEFSRGESILTETSYKYTIRQFQALAAAADYRLEQVWTDDHHVFSIQYLRAC